MTEPSLRSAQNARNQRTKKNYRARIGQHPEPGRLFHPAKLITREEIFFWQRIGRLLLASAELSRTSSYSLICLRPPLASSRPRRGRIEEQPISPATSANSEYR